MRRRERGEDCSPPLCRGVLLHGDPAAAGPRGYKAPMDSNPLIQRKRERFGDLEGQGSRICPAGDPSRRAFQALYL
jgi:hypothetical protein